MSHPYDKTASCQCERCTKERARRAKQSAGSAPKLKTPKPRALKTARYASREEQHGRYIDSGPGAWDDRE